VSPRPFSTPEVRGAEHGWLARRVSGWVTLWDEREPATCLALIRILLAATVLVDLIVLAAFDATSWVWAPISAGGLADWDPASPPSLFRFLPPTTSSAQLLWGGLVLSAFCIGAGCFTRVAALVHVFCSVQAALINDPADRAIDRLIRIVLMILVLSPAGSHWSVDARRATGSFCGAVSHTPGWARYLILGQLVILYLGAGLAKGGTHWYPWGGYRALYLTLQDPILSRVAGARWLEHPLVYVATQVATAVTHLWELGAPVVLVAAYYRRTRGRPGRIRRVFNRLPVRNIYVLVGVVFHLSLAAVLRLGIFPFAMLACFPAFFQPCELERGFARARGVFGRNLARTSGAS
jgi:hypothetical protein